MRNTLSVWCVRGMLALCSLAFAASAQAATIYNFTFTLRSGPVSASGSFTTDGESPLDPGYELLTSLTFDQIIGAETGMAFGPFTAVSTLFEPYVAYNPTTRKFLNHYGGGTYDNVGGLVFPLADGYMLAYYTGFGELGDILFGDIYLRSTGVRVDRLSGNLTSITSAVTAVPEPASLILLGTGLLGAVASRRRRAR